MGIIQTSEGNTFRDAILSALKKNNICLTQRRLPGQNNLALVLRRFVLPADYSYGIRSMYNGYPYHVGILYEDYVYSYMPKIDNLLNASMEESINIDRLIDFRKVADTEIYYITNDGFERSLIISRLINFIEIVNYNMNIEEFNRIYGTTLGEYYNLFINNCEHVVTAILTGKNFSAQAEMVYPDIYYYWPLIKENMCELPLFAQVWINEYNDVMGIEENMSLKSINAI